MAKKQPLYPHVPKSKRGTGGGEGPVTWLLVAMAGTEALEHNAMVGGMLRDIGKKIKGMVRPEEWKDIVNELDWFEHPITEMTANIAIFGSLSELEKHGLDVSRLRKLSSEGIKANEARLSSAAQAKYIQLKDELLSLARSYRGKSNG